MFASLCMLKYRKPHHWHFPIAVRVQKYANMLVRLKNSVLATNSNYLIFMSLQLDGVHLLYFKLILFNITEFITWKSKALGCKDIGVRYSGFVAKTQFLTPIWEKIVNCPENLDIGMISFLKFHIGNLSKWQVVNIYISNSYYHW